MTLRQRHQAPRPKEGTRSILGRDRVPAIRRYRSRGRIQPLSENTGAG